jgi:hypothetical protein
MRITSCVPLAGEGVIARYGALLAVTDGYGPGPNPMLGALAEAAEAAGDGSDLVLRAARAALGAWPQSAWACAGVMADGGVAVLVHGCAVVTVRVEGAPEVTLTASESMLPVSRTFAGPAVVLGLALADHAHQAKPQPDPRFWLGEGVMPGGGLLVTMAVGQAARPALPPGPAAVRPAAPAQWPAPVLPAPVWPAPAEPAEMVQTALDLEAADVAEAGRHRAAGEDPFDWHPPTMDTPVAGLPVAGASAAGGLDGESGSQFVLVEGVLCARHHFNDPAAWCCRQCGIGLDQPPREVVRGPRPPLGVLEVDDGTQFMLDGDYVLGREPTLDGDVLAGQARPMRINDPNGTVSRLHLKISLTGWRVEVSDLGSANGSVIKSPGEERTLTPFEPMIIEPGARIGIGHRSMQYLAYQGVHP